METTNKVVGIISICIIGITVALGTWFNSTPEFEKHNTKLVKSHLVVAQAMASNKIKFVAPLVELTPIIMVAEVSNKHCIDYPMYASGDESVKICTVQ